jgi:Tol biopolymer transport system component
MERETITMKNNVKRRQFIEQSIALSLLGTSVLAGCGSGGGGTPAPDPTPTPVPVPQGKAATRVIAIAGYQALGAGTIYAFDSIMRGAPTSSFIHRDEQPTRSITLNQKLNLYELDPVLSGNAMTISYATDSAGNNIVGTRVLRITGVSSFSTEYASYPIEVKVSTRITGGNMPCDSEIVINYLDNTGANTLTGFFDLTKTGVRLNLNMTLSSTLQVGGEMTVIAQGLTTRLASLNGTVLNDITSAGTVTPGNWTGTGTLNLINSTFAFAFNTTDGQVNASSTASGTVSITHADASKETVDNALTAPLTGTNPTPTPSPTPTPAPVSGKILFVSDRSQATARQIHVMNADGTGVTRLANSSLDDDFPVWSPDGTKIAFHTSRDNNNPLVFVTQVYVMNADGSNQTRLTTGNSSNFNPVWSPSGQKIAFVSNRDGNNEIYVMNADGSNITRLTNNATSDSFPTWSSDGTKIAFQSNRDGFFQIYVMNADGSNQTRLTNSSTNDLSPKWSPVGQKITYVSSGEIYVMNADGSSPTRLTNNSAIDSTPSWSPDGTKIIFSSFRDSNNEIYRMNADGSNQTNITQSAASDGSPSWH